jgi:N-carbamoylputrescine amidase
MKLKVGVCEVAPEMVPGADDWSRLTDRVSEAGLDVFLINEMPFGPWLSTGESFDNAAWQKSLEAHERGIEKLDELGAKVVLGSRAREIQKLRVNEAFVWTPDEGYQAAHTKQFFPDEEGYYEARWFQPGERHFRVAQAGPVRVGFLICTEVMFNEYARRYGRGRAQLIAVPRAVGRWSLPRWLVAMKMAAIVSGCYVLTSNRSGMDSKGQEFGGRGWIVDPNGDMVAQTSAASSVATYTVDLDHVATAQREYPCYVRE